MRDFAKCKLDFLLLQKTKIKNKLSLKRGKNTLLSFKPTNKHYGFGIVYKNTTEIIQTDLISDRVVRINKETFSIVGVCGPTQVRALADENEEITFIEELQFTIEKQPKNTTLILLGDFNAKLGNKKKYGKRQLWKKKAKQQWNIPL